MVLVVLGVVHRIIPASDEVRGWLAMVSPAIGLGPLVWAAATIRCPSCRTPLLWKAMREQGVLNWWPWLIGLSRCPVCGSDGTLA